MTVTTVVFDLDGVILETEEVWHRVRQEYVTSHGGRWTEDDQRACMGANSPQWAAHIRERSGVALSDAEIVTGVLDMLEERYSQHLPLVPGAREAVARLFGDYRLGVASSSPLELIEHALDLAGLRSCFRALVSSDEVNRGKPAPDVYRLACRRLRVSVGRAAAVEDSSSGIRSAKSAGLRVVAIPNADFPPSADDVALADRVLCSISELTPDLIRSLG